MRCAEREGLELLWEMHIGLPLLLIFLHIFLREPKREKGRNWALLSPRGALYMWVQCPHALIVCKI